MASGYLLVVEDNDYLRSDLKDLLHFNDYQVQTASDAVEAWAILERSSDMPLCIISDLMMPGEIDGYGLFERVRASSRWQNTPFILMSGQNDNLPSGPLHLKKPFPNSQLLDMVASTLNQ